MRIIVPHDKGREEAVRRLDEAVDRMLASSYPGIKISDPQKSWEDATMNLSLRVGAGFVNVLVAARSQVEDSQVIIDCELPAIVKHFMPEEKIRAEVEARVRSLLDS